MIARTWRGAVRTADAEAYAAYIDETGMRAYAETPGNEGAYMLTREIAGGLNDRYLVERDATCTHYEVASMARRV